MTVAVTPDQVYRAISTAVDQAFYRAVYPELGQAARDPIRHYARAGWREGRDPAPWFSTDDYLERHPDVADLGINPFYHYLTLGRAEGREILRSASARTYMVERLPTLGDLDWTFDLADIAPVGPMSAPVARHVTPEDRALAATAFDEAFYLAANPDVAASSWNPLDHFLRLGWREGRDPNAGFSTADYLDAYADVEAAGLNPFLHYLRTGQGEGRSPRNALGFRYRLISRLEPVEARLARAARASAGVAASPEGDLAAVLRLTRSRSRNLHVTFSHDDYTTNVGGVQFCLQREAARMGQAGFDHLHLFPVKPWPLVRLAAEPCLLGVVWNGRHAGNFAAATVARALGATLQPGRRSFAIHSLLGHAVEEVVAILHATGQVQGFFWLHDFGSLCAGYHLLRNDVADCAAPPPDSAACGVCVYGPFRARHLDAHERLFAALDLTVVAPSESALATWKAGWDFPTRAQVVQPHARLVARDAEGASRRGPFRFAFLGWAAALKGWPVFRELALKYADDPRYQFLHLGQHPVGGAALLFHPVAVTDEAPLAMRDAIERLAVDAVLIWPLCRETFSFTAYEAAAAGAAILAGPDSGNVAAFVETTGHGRVLPDPEALDALFASGEILDLARAARRPALHDLAYSGMTADLVTHA